MGWSMIHQVTPINLHVLAAYPFSKAPESPAAKASEWFCACGLWLWWTIVIDRWLIVIHGDEWWFIRITMEFIGIMVVYGDFVHDQNLGVPFLWRIDRHCICFFRKMDGSTNRFLGPEKSKSKQKVRFQSFVSWITCTWFIMVPCFKS